MVTTALLCAAVYGGGGWLNTPRPWPLVASGILSLAFIRFLRRTGGAESVAMAAFAAFALAMMGKMLLNARLYHYGFVLGMPATALIVVGCWDWIPARVRCAGGDGRVMRVGVIVTLALFAGVHLTQTAYWRQRKAVTVGTSRDRFYADGRGAIVNDALRWLNERHPPGAARPTMAVLPEGVMINYLARLTNPTPYVNFMPPEFALFNSSRIANDFRRAPQTVV